MAKQTEQLPARTRAAYDHVERARQYVDKMDGHCPMWYGWALREAFLAGVRWQKTQSALDSTKPETQQ